MTNKYLHERIDLTKHGRSADKLLEEYQYNINKQQDIHIENNMRVVFTLDKILTSVVRPKYLYLIDAGTKAVLHLHGNPYPYIRLVFNEDAYKNDGFFCYFIICGINDILPGFLQKIDT